MPAFDLQSMGTHLKPTEKLSTELVPLHAAKHRLQIHTLVLGNSL